MASDGAQMLWVAMCEKTKEFTILKFTIYDWEYETLKEFTIYD